MLYLRDFISTPNRAIKHSDAKRFEEDMIKEYLSTGSIHISFIEVEYVVTTFVRESIGAFLHGQSPTSFCARKDLSASLYFHDYQNGTQKLIVEECILLATDEAHYDLVVSVWENEDKYNIYDNDDN